MANQQVCVSRMKIWLTQCLCVRDRVVLYGNSDASGSFKKVHYTGTLEITPLIQDETFFIPPFTSPLI